MNKKLTSTALAALMIAGTTSFTAFAAMGDGTVVIGTKAYSLTYANDPAHAAEITAEVVAGGVVYVKDFNGNWISNLTGLAINTSVIPAVTYKNATGVVSNFDAADKDLATGVAVASVTATTSKSLKVTFSKAVDTTLATLEVKKGSVKVNTSAITWNTEKTEATVVLAGKLTAGDYTVNVSGLSTVALTGTTTVKDETVSKIEILSTEAPLIGSNLQVGYRVLNQYGEDITKTTSITTSASNVTVNQTTGTVLITGSYNTTTNKLATFTLIHAATATTASATVTAVSEAKVSDVSVIGLYNKDGKTLTETTNLTNDKFYLEIALKDQYGNVINDAAKLDQVIITESNSTVVDAASAPIVIDVNGTKKVVVALTGTPKVGDNIITTIALASGKSASSKVSVAESTRAYNVDVASPELAVANEVTNVPVNVTDKEGNAITDLAILKNADRGVKISVGATDVTNDLIVKNGNVYLPVNFAEGYQSIVIISNATQKVDTLTLQVKAQAKPVIVTGLVSTFSSTLKASQSKTIGVGSLVVEDQYGRVMTTEELNTWLDASAANKIVISDDANSAVVSIGANTIQSTGDTVAVVAGTAIGTEKITVTLFDVDGAITSSAKDATLRVTDGSEYTSYVVSPVGTVYDETATATKLNNAEYNKTVTVKGVLGDGSKVTLTNGTDYTVGSTDTTLNADVANGVIDVTSAYTYGTGVTSVVKPITVTINATGEKFTQDVTISKVAPKVTKLDVVAEGEGQEFIDGDDIALLTKFNFNAITNGQFNFADLDAQADVVATDQYGVSVVLDASGDAFPDTTVIADSTLTFTKVDGSVAFAANGSTSATVTELPLNSIFNVVLSTGGVNTDTIKVTNVTAYSTKAVLALAATEEFNDALDLNNSLIGGTANNTTKEITITDENATSNSGAFERLAELNVTGVKIGNSPVILTNDPVAAKAAVLAYIEANGLDTDRTVIFTITGSNGAVITQTYTLLAL